MRPPAGPPASRPASQLVHQPKAHLSDCCFCDSLSQSTHQPDHKPASQPVSPSTESSFVTLLLLRPTESAHPPARPPTKRQYVFSPRQPASIQPAASQQPASESVSQPASQPASQPPSRPPSQSASQQTSQSVSLRLPRRLTGTANSLVPKGKGSGRDLGTGRVYRGYIGCI